MQAAVPNRPESSSNQSADLNVALAACSRWSNDWLRICLAGLVVFTSHIPSTASAAEFDFDWLAVRMSAVSNATLAKHIEPPTQQQMYLAAAKAIVQYNGRYPARRMSTEFSHAGTETELKELLHKYWSQFHHHADFSAGNTAMAALQSAVRVADPRAQYQARVVEDEIAKQLKENQYIGIGIVVSMTDGWVEITEPIISGPAHLAGARSGDLILSVDGRSCKDKPLMDVIQELRGPKNSKLTVELRNKSETEIRELKMVRTVVPLPSVTGVSRNQDGSFELKLPFDDKIAYLRFLDFVGSSAAELNQLSVQLQASGFEGVVLDFRGVNRSTAAELHHAKLLADALSGRESIAKIVSDQGESEFVSQTTSMLKEMPISVLADSNVSGATMLVLAAIHNRKQAIFVGTPIQSNMRCYRREVLADGMGAIDQFAYAIALPNLKRSKHNSSMSLIPTTHFRPLITPDVSLPRSYQTATESGDPLLRLAAQAISDLLNPSQEVSQADRN